MKKIKKVIFQGFELNDWDNIMKNDSPAVIKKIIENGKKKKDRRI